MLKLTEILKYLITQPHQSGSQVPAFLKVKAGFVGENGDPDALYKRAQGKKYNSPRNLRTLVIGDVGGLIRFHTGLGNSDGKLFYSLKHKLESDEEYMLDFVKENVSLPIESLNKQMQEVGVVKSKSDGIIMQNGISKRNIKFLATGGWGDNTYDFAYIEEILIDSAWAKMMGLMDIQTDLLGVVPILFGGQVDIAKKFPRLMHVGVINNIDMVKDVVKSGKYKFMALEAFGNPTQVGVQKNRAGGMSYVFKTPTQVFQTFKPSREVYELDAKIHEHFVKYKGVTEVPPSGVKEPRVEAEKTTEKKKEGNKCDILLEQFLRQPPPTSDMGVTGFKKIINFQAKPLVVDKESKKIGSSDKMAVIYFLNALNQLKVTPEVEKNLQSILNKNIKDERLEVWLRAAQQDHKELISGSSGPSDLDIEHLDSGIFDDKDQEAPKLGDKRFKINLKSKFLRLRTLKGYHQNKSKIIRTGEYIIRFNGWFELLDEMETELFKNRDMNIVIRYMNEVDRQYFQLDYLDDEERVEVGVFYNHYKQLLLRQIDQRTREYFKKLKVISEKLLNADSNKSFEYLKELDKLLLDSGKYIDSVGKAELVGSIIDSVQNKKIEILEVRLEKEGEGIV